MTGGQLEVVVVLPFLLLGVALVAAFAWVPEPSEGERAVRGEAKRGIGARLGDIAKLVGAWFLLTTLTIWCGAIVAYLVLHGILFTLGQGAASVGLFITVLLLEVAPFAWALVIFRRARRSRDRD